ncbi:MAG: sporulation protein YunB [Eubacteriales bacterium]|nr:sporulation protein YunB [Eubacteriales bacterium]
MRRYMHRVLTRREKLLLLAVAAALALLALVLVAAMHLKPILTSLATTRVSNTVNGIVGAAVNETIYSGDVDYDRLISFEKDNEGRITAVKSNMAEFNRLQSAILVEILTKLSEVSTKDISVPIGTLTGSPLLAGRGPLIRVRMQSVGSSSARFENAFTSAGINQTKHQIYLVVDVYVSILLPGFSTVTRVSSSYAVAETVIVGSVPDNYTYFSNGENMADNAEEYIMNQG